MMVAESVPASPLSDRLIRRTSARSSVATTGYRPVAEMGLANLQREVVALEAARQQTAPLYSLQFGWDSYSALPPDPGLLAVAESILSGLHVLDFPSPDIVPVADGTVSIEWTSTGLEFAVSLIRRDERPAAVFYYLDAKTGEEWETETPDLEMLDRALQSVVSRAS